MGGSSTSESHAGQMCMLEMLPSADNEVSNCNKRDSEIILSIITLALAILSIISCSYTCDEFDGN